MALQALITGITGQDGSYLTELLLGLGYKVHAVVRPSALADPPRHLERIAHLLQQVNLHPAKLEDQAAMAEVIQRVQPDEFYHLAGRRLPDESFENISATLDTHINATHYILERYAPASPSCKIFFAASSEMFGAPAQAPQTEATPFRPRSSYAIAKAAAFDLMRLYRESHGVFACSGILFNHESPRRGLEYVTRKITSQAARIKMGLAQHLLLGDLEAQRDWGSARDFVRAMHLILQQPRADDFVLATGVTHSVREFAQKAFAALDLDYQQYVKVDPGFVRPPEECRRVGDAAKARSQLGWKPVVSFDELIAEMVDADMKRLAGGVDR